MTQRIVATAVLPEDLASADRARFCEALGGLAEAVPELSRSHAGPHVEGSVGGGDLTWDLAVSDAKSKVRPVTHSTRSGRMPWVGL